MRRLRDKNDKNRVKGQGQRKQISSIVVTPVKTGVQYFCNALKFLDSGVHRNDDCWAFSTFDETIKEAHDKTITQRIR
jgi:hypothetical protein